MWQSSVKREPLFNVPTVITILVGLFVIVHVGRTWFLTAAQNQYFLDLFAFIPARYDNTLLLGDILPGGWPAEVWTFFSYSLIHATWLHLGVNALWFLPFGSAIARRFGPARFLAFFAVTAAAGAMLHLFTHGGDTRGDRRVGRDLRHHGRRHALCLSARRPAKLRGAKCERPLSRSGASASLRAARSARARFIVVWFGINFLFGAGSLPLAGDEVSRWPGRRISAAFSPGCCCFPGSIRPDAARRPRSCCNAALGIVSGVTG